MALPEEKIYTVDEIPNDVEVYTSNSVKTVFKPLDDNETYQVEIVKADLKKNFYYKENETDPKKRGNKYVISFEFAILDDNEFYGRRLWKEVSLSLKPARDSYEATNLYKIVTKVMKTDFTWEECESFAPDAKTLLKNLQSEILGKQLRVDIETKMEKDGNSKSSIKVYKEAKKYMEPFDAEKSKAIGEVRKAEALDWKDK